jgi:hypothetical protein
MTTFIPYQIDYSVQNTAKTLGFSKKKVLFKFGFANEKSVQSGLTGPACRGSEHELLFIWSLNSVSLVVFFPPSPHRILTLIGWVAKSVRGKDSCY